MTIDLTDPELAARFALRTPDGEPIEAAAYHVGEGWYEQLHEIEMPARGKAPARRRRITRRVHADYDVVDLLHEHVTSRVRRFS